MKALELIGVKKTYPSGFEALKHLDLRVDEGDFFALLGPNGAGKSTTIGIIASLIKKTSGSVKIFGTDIDRNPTHAKTYLGLVPQEINFNQFEPAWDILINQAGYYGISRTKSGPLAEFYLKKLGLWDKRFMPSRGLSGGMKRRLMIARALIHKPKMLILDEPTAGVDVELRRSMWQFLQEINETGTTIILTTHYLEEAEFLCRGLAIIDKGQIIEQTTVKKVLSRIPKETFILDLAQAIKSLPESLPFAMVMRDPQTLEVTLPAGQSLNALFDVVNQQAWEVKSMRNKVNRLEELFLDRIEQHTTA